MVAVGINNGNPFTAVMFANPFDHHSFNVDVAESPIAVHDFHCVVTGRADKGECPAGFLFKDEPCRLNGATGGDAV